jgi:hypothetical protein
MPSSVNTFRTGTPIRAQLRMVFPILILDGNGPLLMADAVVDDGGNDTVWQSAHAGENTRKTTLAKAFATGDML